jgi:DUF971 family protein
VSEVEIALFEGGLAITIDGRRSTLAARTLRAACRCATCRAAERRGTPVSPAADVTVCDVAPIGAYAAQLRFSDGHDRGIYPLPYLAELVRNTQAQPAAPSA